MKRQLSKLLLPMAMMLPTALLAQTNSVELKDGNGILINSYNSVTDAYGAIPATIAQAYIVELQTNYTGSNETFPINFVAKTGASATNTITLEPAADVTSVSIDGNISGASGVIVMNAATYFIIDGRPGGAGTTKALTINNQSTDYQTATVLMQNGSSNDVARYCNITGVVGSFLGPAGIYLNATANGNSNNLFDHVTFNGSWNEMYFDNGNYNNANMHNKVYGCEFVNIPFNGIWYYGEGNRGLTVDSSSFYSTATSGDDFVGPSAIMTDGYADTIIFTRNKVYAMDNSNYASYVYGFHIRSTSDAQTSYAKVANNFFAMSATNSASTTIAGIEYGFNGSSNHVADIYYNTVRVEGVASSGNSAAFFKDGSASNCTFNIKNNIFVNERTGGSGPHPAIMLTDNSGTFNIDYNTYSSADLIFAQIVNNNYATFAAYQTAMAPNEVNSNSDAVNFVSATDLHLTGASIGDPLLTGTTLPGYTTDIDGDTRTVPYRGGDEVAAPCTPVAGTISASTDSACGNASFTVTSTGASVGNGYTYQWQNTAPNGTFADIAGATNTSYTTSITQTMVYRFITKCNGNQYDTSNTDTVYLRPLPSATGITHTNVGTTYTFTGTGIQNATSHQWLYGDGGTGTNGIHTYTASGNYTVKLILTNQCGNDTISITLPFAVGIAGINATDAIKIYPNPANDKVLIQTDDAAGFNSIVIYNMMGAAVQKTDVKDVKEYMLNTSTLPAGQYMLQIFTNNGTVNKALQVLH